MANPSNWGGGGGIFSFSKEVCSPVGKRVSLNTHLFGVIKGRKVSTNATYVDSIRAH